MSGFDRFRNGWGGVRTIHTSINNGEPGDNSCQGHGIHSLELVKLLVKPPPVHTFGLADELGRQRQESFITAQGAAKIPRAVAWPVALARLLTAVVEAQAVAAGKHGPTV